MPSLPFSLGLAAAALLAGSVSIVHAQTANVEMTDLDGETLGALTLTGTPNGVLIQGELQGLEPGEHGFHFHQVGEPPFESAGGHFNPDDSDHGFLVEGGPHAGDMPNIHVGDDGSVMVEAFNPRVSLAEGAVASLVDGYGTAILIHAEPDDYESQPSGDAGDRIACGVVQ